MRMLGQMSGTSVDGCDFVLADIHRNQEPRFVRHTQVDFPKTLRRRLLQAVEQKLSMPDVAQLHFDLGHFYGASMKKLGWRTDAVALHGQTVFHAGGRTTWQLGESSFVAQAMGCPVVADFRVADVARDGQGAPLAPVFHAEIMGGENEPQAFLNLGGIANVTWKNVTPGPRHARSNVRDYSHVRAVDTGPANILMDQWIQKSSRGRTLFDKDGALAAMGIPNTELVHRWLRHPYFLRKGPKSTGREMFGQDYLKGLERDMVRARVSLPQDKMATLMELTVQSIYLGLKKLSPKQDPVKLWVAGGGAKNPTLMKRLRIALGSINVLESADLGWPPEAIEGGAFALLGAYRLWGLSLKLDSITGSRKGPVSLGKVTLP